MELSEFDAIFGMDWLGEHNIHIDCQRRELIVDWSSERLITFTAQKPQPEGMYLLYGSDQVHEIDPMFWFGGQ